MKLKSRNQVRADFEMSSMTDLVFLLLVFFMLITTLIVPHVNVLKLLLPNSETAKPTENITLSVSINENLEYFVDQIQTPIELLSRTIEDKIGGKNDPTIILHSDNKVPIENVVKVMDIANKLKVKMVLATYPEK